MTSRNSKSEPNVPVTFFQTVKDHLSLTSECLLSDFERYRELTHLGCFFFVLLFSISNLLRTGNGWRRPTRR